MVLEATWRALALNGATRRRQAAEQQYPGCHTDIAQLMDDANGGALPVYMPIRPATLLGWSDICWS